MISKNKCSNACPVVNAKRSTTRFKMFQYSNAYRRRHFLIFGGIFILFVILLSFNISPFYCSTVPMFQCSNVLAFTPPSAPPPGDNVAPPLNTGSDDQGKLGDLGIGTASPAAGIALDVTGIIESTGAITSGGQVTGTEFSIGSYYLRPNNAATSLYTLGSITALGTTDANYFAGNVGIGTTSPAGYSTMTVYAINGKEPLTLRAQAGYSLFRMEDQAGTTRAWFGNDTGSRFQVKNFLTGGDLYLTTTGTGRVIIDNGQVGIGTTSPVTKLHVAGTVSADMIRSDIGINFQQVLPPPLHTLNLETTSGLIDAGLHNYFMSYTTALGETKGNWETAGYPGVTTDATHAKVTVSWSAPTDYRVTGYKIYRTTAGGYVGNAKLLTTITNVGTLSYLDNIPDSGLTGDAGYGFQKGDTTNNIIQVNGLKAFYTDKYLTTVGYNAGASLTMGNGLYVGSGAGQSVTTGVNNTFVGINAGSTTVIGVSNVFVGPAGRFNKGSYNTYVGASVFGNQGNGGSVGNYNIGMGYLVNYQQATATTGNTIIGSLAAQGSSLGNYNTMLGYATGYVVGGAYNLFLGNSAGSKETGSNKIILDTVQRSDEANGRSQALIYGVTSATPANQILALGGGGSVGIGTTSPAATALLDLTSTEKGFLAPRMTTVQRDAILSPATGLFIYNTTTNQYNVYNGTLWGAVGGGGGGIGTYVGATSSTYSGNNNNNNGYAYAHARCVAAFSGSHVCAAYEILNTIASGGTLPAQDVWIFTGPPGYTALANDCNARTLGTSAAYGAYWQKPGAGYPEGRGLLMRCDYVLRLACCM